jgi:hypothetical protein
LLELPAAKVARAVLRGPWGGNAPGLPDHHDVVVQDDAGKTLARRRLPEGVDGIARFHELVASCWGRTASRIRRGPCS